MKLTRWAGASDPGRKRRHNEDAYVVQPPLFAVADGMGGAQAGEVASKLAAGAVKDSGADVEELIQEANRRVHQRSLEDPNASGMGTTLTVASVDDGVVLIGHVGDSRAYLVRDGSLEQLTEDHSLVAELMRSGKLSAEEAESHPQRSVITRALGTDPDVDVDMFPVEAHDGDLFLLCSDGLTTMIGDEEILRVVEQQRGDLQALVKALIKAANKGGGEDNITVVAFELAEAAEQELEETAVVQAPVPEPDEEDTLTELDKVPAVDTMVVSAEEIAAAYEREPEPPRRRRRRLTRALSFVLVIALLVALAFLILWGLSR